MDIGGFFSEFDSFSYMCILKNLALVDGLQAEEFEFLSIRSSELGLNYDDLVDSDIDVSSLSWPVKVLLFRDLIALALIDSSSFSDEESVFLKNLQKEMDISDQVSEDLLVWVKDQENLINRLSNLLTCQY